MEAIHIASTPAELYNAVLVDTPLAPFFESCINEQDLDEMNIEIIRNTLYKSYLEAFFEFCKAIGGETEDVMCPILAFEADRRAFIITINSGCRVQCFQGGIYLKFEFRGFERFEEKSTQVNILPFNSNGGQNTHFRYEVVESRRPLSSARS